MVFHFQQPQGLGARDLEHRPRAVVACLEGPPLAQLVAYLVSSLPTHLVNSYSRHLALVSTYICKGLGDGRVGGYENWLFRIC